MAAHGSKIDDAHEHPSGQASGSERGALTHRTQ
jgi:hypothetical protein